MDSPHVQPWMQDGRPDSGVFQTFDDVPLTSLHKADTSGGFSHLPLEHEMVASESIWDESGTSDELIEEQIVFSPVRSGRSSPVVGASTPEEHSMNMSADQAQVDLNVSQDIGLEKVLPTSALLGPCSNLAGVSRSGFASAETLVETRVAPDTTSGPTVAPKKESFSSELRRKPNDSLSITESDIGDELSKSWEHSNKSKNPLNLTISTASSARVLAHSNLPRIVKPTTPASIPESFDIPIPIFPFPAGTSRCKNRDCPIKIPHEQGPYLHEGKLRTREGSIFGSSNPPPEIWFLYDRSGNGDLLGVDDKPFAPVELFVRYHFGETRGECVSGPDEARRDEDKEAKLRGKKSLSWRFWSREK